MFHLTFRDQVTEIRDVRGLVPALKMWVDMLNCLFKMLAISGGKQDCLHFISALCFAAYILCLLLCLSCNIFGGIFVASSRRG